MAPQRQISGTGSTPDTPEGLIAGRILRLIREQLGMTQETLAERVSVDANTIKSWETGRRPLGNTKVQVLRSLVRQLARLGADPRLLRLMDEAIEADLFISHVLTDNPRPADHLLAGMVSTRRWNDLLAWAVAGTTPAELRAIVGVGRGPRLPVPHQRRFFDALRSTAEATNGDPSPSAVLLRRQVYFMSSWDDTPAGRDWLARAERREARRLHHGNGWTPTWVAGRSLAVARACCGDPDQLRHFIATQLVDDICEAANLNYWAYWVGEQQAGTAVTDDFMAADLGIWRGTGLLRHLAVGLDDARPYVDLNIHSVWALLQRRPHLLGDDLALTDDLRLRVRTLLDGADGISEQARRELNEIRYVASMKGPR